MPTNTAITASIVFPGQVPSDRECTIGTLSDIIQGVVDYTTIASTDPDGNITPPDNSIANQALSTANAALALSQSIAASLKDTRSGVPQPVPTGDNSITFPFSVAMPSTDYIVTLTLYAGNTTHPAAYFGVRVVESSMTVDGFTVLTENIPANTKLGYWATMR